MLKTLNLKTKIKLCLSFNIIPWLSIGLSIFIYSCGADYKLRTSITTTVRNNELSHNENTEQKTDQTFTDHNIEPKVAPSPETLCQNLDIVDSSQPVTLSNLQFHRPIPIPFSFNQEIAEDYLIGCITNHTQQPIAGINLQLNLVLANGNGYASGMIDFPGESISPGETLPFRHLIELNSDTVEVNIQKVKILELMSNKVTYQQVDQFNPQQTVAYVPAKSPPTGESVDNFCDNVEPVKTDQEIEVNNLQIYNLPKDMYDFEEEQESLLVGCITNHSDQPLGGLGMSYSSNGQGIGGATVTIPVDVVKTGETVPFYKYGSISDETEFIVIHNIGGSTGQLKMNTKVNR